MRNSLVVAIAASFLSAAPLLAQSAITYDSLMKQDTEGRSALFSTLSPENRGAIMNTHIQRWIAKNRARLSSEQITLLEERMALVTEEVSGRLPKTRETSDRLNDLQRRTARAFSWEDMRQATTTLHADYIPGLPSGELRRTIPESR